MSGDDKDDSGRFSCLLSSSGSPGIGFSRSSSRLSFQDDLDDSDFSCPFIVDDFDTSDLQARYFCLLFSEFALQVHYNVEFFLISLKKLLYVCSLVHKF